MDARDNPGIDGEDPIEDLLDDALTAGHRADDHASVLERLSVGRMVLLHDIAEPDREVLQPDAAAAATFGGQRYQVVGEIARGGVGVVFKGRDADLGRDIAIKVLRDEHAGNREMVERFVEEAQIAGQLEHPGVLPVHELGLRQDRRPFFTMKLVRGKPLSEVLAERGGSRVDRDRLLGLFLQVCQAVAYAHARGVIHRDLKPSNVLVGAFGEVHVTDWGLAKVLGRGVEGERRSGIVEPSEVATVRTAMPGAVSQTGSVMGTPAYMPPEQARGEVEKLDRRSDVFGLGAILCEILTGQPPFTAASEREIRELAARGDVGDALLRLEAARLEPQLLTLAKACLDPKQASRPRDAGEMSQRLEHYFATLSAQTEQARIDAAAARVEAAAAQRARRLSQGLVVSLAAVALLSLGGAIGWNVLEQRSAAERADHLATFTAAVERGDLLRQAAAAVQPPAAEPWERALEVADQAAELARGDMPEELCRQARELRTTVAASLDAAREDVERRAGNAELLAALEPFKYLTADPTDEAARIEAAMAAFTAHGIPLFDGPESVVLSVLRERGIDTELASGFDAWAMVLGDAADGTRRHRLTRYAIALDDNTIRRQVWEAYLRVDAPALERLANLAGLAEQPPEVVSTVVARYLMSRPVKTVLEQYGDRKYFVERQQADWALVTGVLRRALLRHPDDVWLNWMMKDAVETGTRENRMEIAIGYARAGVAAMPEAPEGWYLLALALTTTTEHREESLSWFDKVIAVRPAHRGALWNKGTALLILGRPKEAVVVLEQCHDLDPKDVGVALNLGHALWASGRREESIEPYRVAARYASNPEYEVYLALRLEMLGRKDEALEEAKNAVHAFPDAPHARWELARMLNERGKYEEAEDHAERARVLAPDLPEPHFYLAEALLGLGDRDGAIASYEKAEAVGPDATGPPLELGRLYVEDGRVGVGLAAYRRAAASPELLDLESEGQAREMLCMAHNGMGCALSLVGRFDEAIAEFETVFPVDAAYGKAYENLALVHERRGEYGEAVEVLERGLPSAPWVRAQLARDLVRLGRVAEARDVAAAGVAAAESAAAFALLAEVLEAADDLDGALDACGRAIDLSDDAGRDERVAARDRCRRLVDLSRSFADVLTGMLVPETFDELEAAARLCEIRKERVAAARLWQLAMTRDPDRVLATDRDRALRAIEAVLEATMVAAGGAHHELRERGRSWFTSWLTRLEGELEEAGPGLFAERVEELLLDARCRPGIASVRGAALAGLPADEHAAWQALWTRVDAALEHIWKVRWGKADDSAGR